MDDHHRLPRAVASGVHAFERAQQLARHVHRDAAPQRSRRVREAAEQPKEVAPVDPLHREPRLVAVDARAVDLDDVVVAHGGVEGRLALEHRATLRIGHEVRQEALDDELAGLRLRIDRSSHVDLGRTAHREARLEQERAEFHGAAR